MNKMKATTKQILKAAATLPAKQARRVVGAIASAQGEAAPTVDDLLETAAEAMQAAMEAEILPQLETETTPT